MGIHTVALAHHFIKTYVRTGDLCIDATAGRGRDTMLLCQLVGESGHVLAFDVQQQAVEQTRALLQQEGLQTRATVLLESHAHMAQYAQYGTVRCIVFNFGFLPGGDKSIFTQAHSSIEAIAAGLQLLAPGGVMSLSIYYGGPNGYAERDALLSYLQTIDATQYSVLLGTFTNRQGDTPIPVFIWKDA